MKRRLALCLALGLAACGSGLSGDNALNTLGQVIVQGIRGAGGGGDTFALTRADLAAQGFTLPFMVGTLEVRGLRTGLGLAARSRDVVTWGAADNSAISLRQGVLTATRGLGADLYSAETRQVSAAMAQGGPAEYARTYRHLDGLDQIVLTRFTCRLQPAGSESITVFEQPARTRRFDESCRAQGIDAPQITNTYWREGTIMRKSRQWIGPELGYLVMERVID